MLQHIDYILETKVLGQHNCLFIKMMSFAQRV